MVRDSIIACLREVEVSRNKKVKLWFFSGAKLNDLHYSLLFSSFANKKTPDNIQTRSNSLKCFNIIGKMSVRSNLSFF